jgi:hypothetical protein
LKGRGWKPRRKSARINGRPLEAAPFKNPKRQFLQASPQPVKAVPSQGNL